MKISRLTFLFFVIVFFAAVVRFYNLGKVPFGLNTDETAIGYNAYSILESGKDEHGVKHPLYFLSFGDNKLPIYIYSTVGMIKLLGPTPLAVRLTSTIFGVIAVVTIYALIRVLSKNEMWALFGAFLLAINPWSIFFSRTGFEVNVATTYMLLGTLFYFLWLKSKRFQIPLIVLSIVFFLLSAYCYNATRLLSPILLATLLVYSYFFYPKIKRVRYLLPVVLFGIGLIPFAISFLHETGIAAQETLLLTGGESQAEKLQFKSYLTNRPAQLLFSSPSLYLWHYLKNIFSFINVNFFFVSGPDHPINGVPGFGMFHLIEMLLIPLGLFVAIKKRISYLYPFLAWIAVVILFGSITREVPHPTRTYAILYPFIIFSSYGLFLVFEWIKQQKKKPVRLLSILAITGFFAYSITLYLTTYFLYFPTVSAKDWRSQDQKLAEFLKQQEPNYEHIIIEENADFAYTSLLFYTKFDPETVHKGEYGKDGLLTTLKKFGKYEYKPINPDQDTHQPNTLIVTTDEQALNATQVNTFYLPTQKKVLFYDNQFMEIPEKEIKYKVYSTK